jgi:hypothetical protein
MDAPQRQPSRYNKAKLSSPSLPAIAPPSSFQHPTQARYKVSGGHDQAHAQRPTTSGGPAAATSAHAQALQLLERENMRQAKLREQQDEDRRVRRRLEAELKQAEADKRRAEKDEEERLRKIKEREEAEIAQAAKEEADLWRDKKKTEKEKTKHREKMDKLRAKAEALDEPNSPPPLLAKLGFFRRKQSASAPVPRSTEQLRPQTSKGEKPVIKAGGGGIVPLNDAPVSAINHGDRRVRVVTQGKSILLPIKPTTTPLQLIRSSVTFFDAKIDPRNSFLMEDFTQCGIQRKMRMYEPIRNVLNSWDTDDQHTLTLMPYDSSQDSTLHATWAPKSRPPGGKWTLYLSQERGKWDKRVITMTNEGQILAAKNEDGKGSFSVCHLSDFEVYSLSRDGEKKRVKPPKKYCYAIKSVQKSSMFLGDTGFIHMFCSSDQAIAQSFNDTIYKWRCHYLVHVMGENGESKEGLSNSSAARSGPLLSAPSNVGDKRLSNYILGSFNNELQLDFQTFTVKEEPKKKHTRVPSDTPLANAIAVSAMGNGLMSASEHSKALHARQQSIRRAAGHNPHPPVSSVTAYTTHNRDQSNNSSSQTDPSSRNSSQAANGLQRNSSVRSTNRRSIERSNSARHHANSGASVAPPASFGKPLIDLTPAYIEPPQHRYKGRGVKIAEGPLVEAATTPREPGAIVIPESQDWRVRNAGAGQGAFTGGMLARNNSVRSQTGANKRNSGTYGGPGYGGPGRGLIGELPGNEGFTGAGLLAQHVSKP